MKRTGGKWDPSDTGVYFIASPVDTIETTIDSTESILIAVNELADEDMPVLEDAIARGKRLFIDSGIFWLTNSYARANGISMDQALAMAPSEFPDFPRLLDKYRRLIDRIGSQSWGYIEMDQGGLVNKRKTRAMLEDMGLRPIPVYHPLVDGWDYFDELAEQYDRICFANLVQADKPTRIRLMATCYERRRKYPHLWIHLLGVTPNELFNAIATQSSDSSTWLRPVRWTEGHAVQSSLKRFGYLPDTFRYKLGADKHGPNGHRKSWKLCAYDAHMIEANWRQIESDHRQARL